MGSNPIRKAFHVRVWMNGKSSLCKREDPSSILGSRSKMLHYDSMKGLT